MACHRGRSEERATLRRSLETEMRMSAHGGGENGAHGYTERTKRSRSLWLVMPGALSISWKMRHLSLHFWGRRGFLANAGADLAGSGSKAVGNFGARAGRRAAQAGIPSRTEGEPRRLY
jgi:hypothetical protein